MALIGTIRKNGWILIVLLALALGGFILMDIMQNKSNYSMADLNTVGKVNGATITRDRFDRYEEAIWGGSADLQQKTTTWNYLVDNALVEAEAAPLGIGVSKDELLDLQFGASPSPILAQRQITPDVAQNIKQQMDAGQFTRPEARLFWSELEKEVIHERTQTKLLNLIAKGVYAPAWQAEMAFRENNERLDFLYTRIPFDKVTDAEAPVTDADFAAFLKEHSKQYYQNEETRLVNYVVVDVIPTAKDTADARETVAKLLAGFRAATNDSLFVNQNQGMISPDFKKKDALPAAARDSITSKGVGAVVGPYIDGDSWVIAKILDRKSLPDSVKARHILIRRESGNAEKTVDSLKTLVDSGKARFDSLAAKFGTDGTSTKGGDLGWFAQGAMVAEFNELCFNKAEQGKTYKVITQFGVHLVEVTGKKFLTNESSTKLATVAQRIAPGSSTQQTAKEKAINLATQAKNSADLENMAKNNGFTLQTSTPVKAFDLNFGSVGQGSPVREIIRWAFDEKTKKDVVRKDYFIIPDQSGGYFDAKYVVTALKSINPKGEPTVEGLRAQIESQVKNRKKASVLRSKITNTSDLSALASQFSVSIDSAKGVSFTNPSLVTGPEPRVVGTAYSLKNGESSKLVEGASGMYVVRAIMDKPTAQLPPDMAMFRRQATSSTSGNVRTRMMQILRRGADVEDFRSRFF